MSVHLQFIGIILAIIVGFQGIRSIVFVMKRKRSSRQLHAADRKTRLAAVYDITDRLSIKNYYSPEDIALLLNVLATDTDWQVRREALRAFPEWLSEKTQTQISASLEHDTAWQVRRQALKCLSRLENSTLALESLFDRLYHDPAWQVRRESLIALHDTLQTRSPTVLSVLTAPLGDEFLKKARLIPAEESSEYQQIYPVVVHALHDNHASVRATAALALREFSVHLVFEPLKTTRQDAVQRVRQFADDTLAHVCARVTCVVFGEQQREQEYDLLSTLWNPNVSSLSCPMSALEKWVIDVEQGKRQQILQFTEYLPTLHSDEFVTRRLTVVIIGDPTALPSETSSLLKQCTNVIITLDTVIFSQHHITPYWVQRAAYNPNVSQLLFSMSQLSNIVIQADAYDFRQVEIFLTYAVNTLGQRYLKNHVHVHIYGDVTFLHPNLKNNLTAFCRSVTIVTGGEETEEMSVI